MQNPFPKQSKIPFSKFIITIVHSSTTSPHPRPTAAWYSTVAVQRSMTENPLFFPSINSPDAETTRRQTRVRLLGPNYPLLSISPQQQLKPVPLGCDDYLPPPDGTVQFQQYTSTIGSSPNRGVVRRPHANQTCSHHRPPPPFPFGSRSTDDDNH